MDFVANVGERIVGEVKGRSINTAPAVTPTPPGPPFPPPSRPEVFEEVTSVEVTNPDVDVWLVRVHTAHEVAGWNPLTTGDPWVLSDATGPRPDIEYSFESPRASIAFVLEAGTVTPPVTVAIPPGAHQFYNQNGQRIRPGGYTSS